MIDLLKSVVPTAKDLISFRLPKSIQEGLAFSIFLGALVVISGFTYLAFAVDPLPDPLRSELMWPSARLRTYLECGIDGLLGGGNYSFSLAEVVVFLGVTVVWYIAMAILGAATVILHFVRNLLRDRIDANILELSDGDLERLKEAWKKAKTIDGFDSHLKSWKDWVFTAQLCIFSIRFVLLLGLLVPSVALLISNPLSVAILPIYLEKPVPTELARWSQEMGSSHFWLVSIFSLAWAWISFRYSHAGVKFLSLILFTAVANMLLFVGSVGSLKGASTVRLQEIQIIGDRFGDEGALTGSGPWVLLDKSRVGLRVYSCNARKVMDVKLSDADILVEGNLVPVASLCQHLASFKG